MLVADHLDDASNSQDTLGINSVQYENCLYFPRMTCDLSLSYSTKRRNTIFVCLLCFVLYTGKHSTMHTKLQWNHMRATFVLRIELNHSVTKLYYSTIYNCVRLLPEILYYLWLSIYAHTLYAALLILGILEIEIERIYFISTQTSDESTICYAFLLVLACLSQKRIVIV